MEKLTDHFSLEEMTRTDVKKFIDQNREITGSVRANLETLCRDILEPIRHKLGPVIIHSAYRCPELNAHIGGAPRSDHQDGNAADFHVMFFQDDFGLGYCVSEIAKMGLSFGQLILEPSWVHISRQTDRHSGEILRYDGQSYTKLDLAQLREEGRP